MYLNIKKAFILFCLYLFSFKNSFAQSIVNLPTTYLSWSSFVEYLSNKSQDFILNSSSQTEAATKELIFNSHEFPKSTVLLSAYFNNFWQNLKDPSKQVNLNTTYYLLDYVNIMDQYHKNLKNSVVTWDDLKKQPNNYRGSQCDQVCPHSLEILKFIGHQKVANSATWPTFLNSKEEYRNIQNVPDPTFNYCIGHSFLKLALRHLAFFDPENTMNSYKSFSNAKAALADSTFKEELLKRLNTIVRYNTPQILPYVKNIHELSSLFENEMKQQLAWSWYAYGVSWKNLLHTSMNKHDNFFSESILNLVADLKKRILSGITPIIIFNAQGETIGHSAQVHEVHTEKLTDGRINYRLVLDDSNNQPAEGGDFNQKNSLYLKQGDDSFYDLFDEEENKLGRLEIIDSSDPFYERIILPLSNFCRKQTHCLEK